MTQQQSIYCPNLIFDNDTISIGEFKTIDDCMNYPIKEWCITKEDDNKFDAYKRQGDRLLIICSWERQDSQRFVVAIANRSHKIKYFDLNDLPMDLVAKDYEQSLGNDAISILKQYGITNESKTNKNMKKNTIKLTESQLKKVIAESVKKVLKEEYELPWNPLKYQDVGLKLEDLIHTIDILRQRINPYGKYDTDEEREVEHAKKACKSLYDALCNVSDTDIQIHSNYN